MDQSMEKFQRQIVTIQERINENWDKKYVEVDSKMEEMQEQVDNNSGKINGICEDLKEQKREIVIKKQIGNQDDHAMEDAIIREAVRGEPETWYRTKVREYRNFKQFRKGFMKNYRGTKIIGDGITTEMDSTKIHIDLENSRGREEMMEPLKDIKMKMRTIDQVVEM
ncbi:hypothetical protein FQA39_LY04349 [Lamprigera yunnana]|nr:hypothetical protein FQA39_LY04349 [Lamprigera yunnana]